MGLFWSSFRVFANRELWRTISHPMQREECWVEYGGTGPRFSGDFKALLYDFYRLEFVYTSLLQNTLREAGVQISDEIA